jgi:hypothetical protein
MKWMLGAVAAAGMAMSASAADLVLDFQGVGPGVDLNYTYSTAGKVNVGTTAGVFNWEVVTNNTGYNFGSTIQSFCIELTQFTDTVGGSSTSSFNLVNPANAPNSSPPGGMGPVRASLLGSLYGQFYNQVKAVIAGFSSTLTHDNGSFTNVSANQAAAAFQVAIWEIVHEDQAGIDDDNLSSFVGKLSATNNAGTFFITSNNSTVINIANAFLTDVMAEIGNTLSTFGGLSAMTSPDNQDQIIVVPVPAPAALAGLGLIGIVALRRRMKA